MDPQCSQILCTSPSPSSKESYLLVIPSIQADLLYFKYQCLQHREFYIIYCNYLIKMTTNPFKLQTDNKRFFFDVVNQSSLDPIPEYSKTDSGANRIKNMANELQDLAKKREEMLFKQSEINYIFKKQKGSVPLTDFITSVGNNNQKDKKFRVRALLKQKKESVHDFLQKKKEIYLSKMNIIIKKQQTTKLEDAIKDDEETLKAHKLYFDNDVEFMHKFIEGIKKQAEQAQTAVQSQLKVQESLVSKLNSVEAEMEKIDNLISKDTEALNNLKTYKEFIDSLYDPERNWKPYIRKTHDDPMFLTENILEPQQRQNLTIRYQPENLLEIFNNAEENNIREIQNLHDKEDQVQSIKKVYNNELGQYQKLKEEKEGFISSQEKTLEKKTEDFNKLKEMKKNNINKISILDNQNVDLDKVTHKVVDIFKELNQKTASENIEGSSQKIMKKAMTQIQQQVQRLRLSIKSIREAQPSLIFDVQKEIKQNQKKQNLSKKKAQAIQLQLKKQRQQQKKRNEPPNEQVKGRRDMRKVLHEKKAVVKKEVDVKTVDESEKYFTMD